MNEREMNSKNRKELDQEKGTEGSEWVGLTCGQTHGLTRLLLLVEEGRRTLGEVVATFADYAQKNLESRYFLNA